MTLLHINGLEAPKRGSSSIGSVVYTNSGRTGRYLSVPPQTSWTVPVPGNPIEITFGVAITQTRFLGSTSGIRLVGMDGSAQTVHLGTIENDNPAIALRVNNVIVATGGAYQGTNIWQYVEIYAKSADSGGRVKVWLDGNVIIDYTGDTKPSTAGFAAGWSSVGAHGGGGGSSTTVGVDDFYLLDAVDATATQGRAFNSFLGPIRVEPRYPTGTGAASDWAGSDGNSVDNYALLDETPPSDTDYVSTSTAGARDLYTYGPLAMPAGTVLAVDVCPYAHTPDAGTTIIKSVIRDSSNNVVVGPGSNPGITSSIISDTLHTKAPDGGLWTVAKANATEFGIEAG